MDTDFSLGDILRACVKLMPREGLLRHGYTIVESTKGEATPSGFLYTPYASLHVCVKEPVLSYGRVDYRGYTIGVNFDGKRISFKSPIIPHTAMTKKITAYGGFDVTANTNVPKLIERYYNVFCAVVAFNQKEGDKPKFNATVKAKEEEIEISFEDYITIQLEVNDDTDLNQLIEDSYNKYIDTANHITEKVKRKEPVTAFEESDKFRKIFKEVLYK